MMTRRPGRGAAASVLATLVAIPILVAPRVVAASCENMIEVRSRELWFVYNDVYPVRVEDVRTPTGDSLLADQEAFMWSAMAQGLGWAVACQRRIESDARLAELLRQEPMRLQMSAGDRPRLFSEAEISPSSRSDSLLAVFDSLAADSAALLYSVRVGSFVDQGIAHRAMERLGWLGALRESGSEWDSTVVLDWTHQDCTIGEYERPTLFMLPPRVSNVSHWCLMSGLFFSQRDADRRRAMIRRRETVDAVVVPIRVTGEVLSHAIPPH